MHSDAAVTAALEISDLSLACIEWPLSINNKILRTCRETL